MRKFTVLIFILTAVVLAFSVNLLISDSNPTERERRAMVNTRIDNMAYWMELAEDGLIPYNPEVRHVDAVFKGSRINATTVSRDDSPDVPVTTVNSTQSENSVFIDPNDNSVVLNSNNSSSWPVSSIYGADYWFSFDSGETYDGSIQGAGGTNQGDPAACIGTDGRWYIGYIASGGQGVSYSDDEGESWTKVQVAPNPGQLADKNHMWIDSKVGSPYENYLYNAWTDFGGTYNNRVVLSRSTDRGESWEAKQAISSNLGGNLHQGVNLSTGPDGEVYACWIIYDTWPSDEKSIGFARSFDGGETWEPAVKAIDNIKGIRSSGVPQGNRVNSFPSMAVDISDGPNSGNIYIVWTNVGVPGINTGGNRDVYMIKSTDEGDTWEEPVRVNQDDVEENFVQFFPWIACDASSGMLSVIFYDNRDSGSLTEAWVANSTNAGESWEDFRVSDVAFNLGPIPGFSGNYAGDYLGITANDGMVYPCWGDNRSGTFLTYISPFETINVIAPSGLQAAVDQETGICALTWNHEQGTGFDHYNVYRNDEFMASVNTMAYTDQLTEYGYYTYKVTASYQGDNESLPSVDETQYGSAEIVIAPNTYTANLYIGDSTTQTMTIKNDGELELSFRLSQFMNTDQPNYPAAVGGGDEYIRSINVSNLNYTTGVDYYLNDTVQYARMQSGNSYPITVQAGNSYNGDQCAVWVDWNNNGNFEEGGITLLPDETSTFFTGNIEAPKGSAQGATRMRVRLVGPGETPAPTGESKYGEVEDYTLIIEDWISIVPDEGLVEPGDSLTVDLKFNSAEMPVGTYEDNVRFITNDITDLLFNLYFTMNVSDMQVSASVDPESICFGESAQLTAVPSGGSGSYTYAWTSNQEGFESTAQNPVVTPEVNTEYYLAASDGIITTYDTVSVTVNALPEVDLGTDEVLCGETSYPLDAGNPGAEYMWSTGETSQTINATGDGNTVFWVEVTNASGCTSSDTVALNFASIPAIDLGADTTICHNSEMMLDAGNPDAGHLWSTGETTQTIVVNAEDYDYGQYEFSCEVTNADGCSNTDLVTIEIKDCTGIDEFKAGLGIDVFPNPSNGVFNLEINSSSNKEVSVRVLSIIGKLVYQRNYDAMNGLNTMQIDLNGFAEGVYTVFVSSGNTTLNKKVVLRR